MATATIDTFPGLQQDCLDLIKKSNRMILLARTCRSAAALGDGEAIRSVCKEINEAGEDLGGFAEAFEHTTDHLGDDEEGEG